MSDWDMAGWAEVNRGEIWIERGREGEGARDGGIERREEKQSV